MIEMGRILKSGKLIEAEEIDEEKLKGLSEETRREIMRLLAQAPSYPLAISKEMGIEKQKTYYHFGKLEEAGLIEEIRKEKRSGGMASFYQPTQKAYYMIFSEEGETVPEFHADKSVSEFLSPLIANAELEGKIVVGSPDQHGPDQVRARDGYLAGEIGLKLGRYCDSVEDAVVLDTEVFRDGSFDGNLLLIGGVLTNTVTKKFNESFPAYFSGDDFPYREIETPESKYSDADIGLIAKAEHPEADGKFIYMIAGVRNRGTRAAVRAFKNLEEVIDEYAGGEYYRVVRGLDMDGDGEIDSYEVIE